MTDAVAELRALQAEHAAWLDALPDNLRPTRRLRSFKPAMYEYVNADPQTCAIRVNPKKIYP